MSALRARIRINTIDTLADVASVISFEVMEGVFTEDMPLKTSSATYYPEKIRCLNEALLEQNQELRNLREKFLSSDPSDPDYNALSLQFIQRSNEIYEVVREVQQGTEARMMIRNMSKADADQLRGQEITLKVEKKPGFFARLFGSRRK